MKVTAARLTGVLAALLFIAACGANASAQAASKAAIIATNSCKDAFGTPVVLEYVANAQNALLLNGSPVILLDANVINHEPIQVAEFLYFSECAHHVLGHVLRAAGGSPPLPGDGAQADCWALRFLQRHSGYGPADTAIILAGLSALHVASYPYVQGIARANNLKTCR